MEDGERDDLRDLLEAIVIITECKHSCICGCHNLAPEHQHDMQCCTPCSKGHDRIRHGTILQHLMECHGEKPGGP